MTHAVANWLFYQAYLRRRRPVKVPYRKLCIYKVDRLGDFVLALGAIRQLVRSHGQENCVLVISSYAAELAEREFPGVDRVVLPLAEGYLWRTPRHLRAWQSHPLFQRGVDHLVCLRYHRTPFEELLISTIPARETWGTRNYELYREPGDFTSCKLRFDREVESLEPASNECRELAVHRSVVTAFSREPVEVEECLPQLSADLDVSESAVGISPFGSDAIRNFPPKLLSFAARAVAEKTGLPFHVWTPPGQEEKHQGLADLLRREGVADIAVKVLPTVRDLVQAVVRSAMVLSADTATAHIATALDRPLIAVLGGGHYGWFGPWSRSTKQRWVTNEVGCFQCNWSCRHPEPLCITGIPGERIAELALAAARQM